MLIATHQKGGTFLRPKKTRSRAKIALRRFALRSVSTTYE
jgi:hypothetical protein